MATLRIEALAYRGASALRSVETTGRYATQGFTYRGLKGNSRRGKGERSEPHRVAAYGCLGFLEQN